MDSLSSGCHRSVWESAPRRAPLTVPTTRTSVTLMHRDTKLGLALAILVMGFAAALCFPRESGEKPVDLALQSANEIDSLIGRGQVKIHRDADRPKPRGTKETPSDPTLAVTPDQEVLPLAFDPDQAFAPREPEPTPIEPANFPPEVVAPPEPVVHTRTYVVQPLDTLSGIARKQLGDGSRYHELVNANSHLNLQDPKSLKPGMELLIPIPDGDETTPATNDASPVVTAPLKSPAVPARQEPLSTSPAGHFGVRPPRAISSAPAAPKLN